MYQLILGSQTRESTASDNSRNERCSDLQPLYSRNGHISRPNDKIGNVFLRQSSRSGGITEPHLPLFAAAAPPPTRRPCTDAPQPSTHLAARHRFRPDFAFWYSIQRGNFVAMLRPKDPNNARSRSSPLARSSSSECFRQCSSRSELLRTYAGCLRIASHCGATRSNPQSLGLILLPDHSP